MPRSLSNRRSTVPSKTCQALIADDSREDQLLISRFVRCIPDFRVIACVQDGIEAVHYFEGSHGFGDRDRFPYPDLLLLDYQMPGMNGTQVLQALSAEKWRPKIVLWSNVIELVDQSLAQALGADLVCQKPDSIFDMLAVINQLDWPVANLAGCHFLAGMSLPTWKPQQA